MIQQPTPYADVNAMLQDLFGRVQPLLGSRLAGMYLDGSLTTGDFDQDSDIDFVVVTQERITPPLFMELQAMHDALARTDSVWAIQLEGSYLSRHALRRHDPADTLHPNLERGVGERLKWAQHDQTWDLHRHVLRERGIVLYGPAPDTLIDPVLPEQLRRVMLANLSGWAARMLENPAQLQMRGYQSYTVLSICRILYTLESAEVVSKRSAAGWAQRNLDAAWVPLIETAWVGRHGPDGAADPAEIRATQAFIRYALEWGKNARLPV